MDSFSRAFLDESIEVIRRIDAAAVDRLAAVVWHLLVSHPALKVAQTKWESVR
jgi:hypothetical protein